MRSYTVGLEAVFAAGDKIGITPSLRLYSQTAASFFYDPVYSYIGEPFPPAYLEAPPIFLSPDQRLAMGGAWFAWACALLRAFCAVGFVEEVLT